LFELELGDNRVALPELAESWFRVALSTEITSQVLLAHPLLVEGCTFNMEKSASFTHFLITKQKKMSIPHIIKNDTDNIYFLTFTTVEWVDIFTNEILNTVIIDSLKYCRKNKGFTIICFVLMTNHLHIICRAGKKPLDAIIRDFKRHTTKQVKKELEKDSRSYIKNIVIRNNGSLWQKGNFPEIIVSEKFLMQKLEYIHNNPVKKGFVERPENWKYSSASNYITGKGLLEIEWVNGNMVRK